MRYYPIPTDGQTLLVPELASCYGCGKLAPVLIDDSYDMLGLVLGDHGGRSGPWLCPTSTWYVNAAPAGLNLAWGPSFGPVYTVVGDDTVELVAPAARGHELGEAYLRASDRSYRCLNLEDMRLHLGAAA